MENYVLWLIIGFALLVAELLTGTFYLLMFGVAAFGGAAAAWLGQGFPAQIIATAVVAATGSWLVYSYRLRNARQQMKSVDYSQPVIFEKWVDQQERIARVRYRDASWEAQVEAGVTAEPGATLYIVSASGSMLNVVKSRPT